jgi:SAM-dependent methyltransferase
MSFGRVADMCPTTTGKPGRPPPATHAASRTFSAKTRTSYAKQATLGTDATYRERTKKMASPSPSSDDVRVLRRPQQELDILYAALRESQRGDEPVRVLEAGCGHHWPLQDADVPLRITGVDTDADALRIRRDELGDLHDEIIGDLRTVELPVESFDVVYCSWVLEHIEGAEGVLDRFVNVLRPGGRLIIRVPDGDSVYGYLTKHTPHRLHVLYKRHIERRPHAGEPGHAPYPVVYDPIISVRGMRSWADRRGLLIADEYSLNFYLQAFKAFRPVVALGLRTIAALSLGRLSATHNNIGYVIVKQAELRGTKTVARKAAKKTTPRKRSTPKPV